MLKIRKYSPADYPLLKSWWEAAQEAAPLPGMMPKKSSFILEIDGVPALSLCVYLTNTKEICYLENFVGNPALKGEVRKQAAKVLVEYAEHYARTRGFKRTIFMTLHEALKDRYEEFGYATRVSSAYALVKEIS